jgi:hypothetical protein
MPGYCAAQVISGMRSYVCVITSWESYRIVDTSVSPLHAAGVDESLLIEYGSFIYID